MSCCRALEVPGGSFIRDYDGKQYTSQNYTAAVSSFLMDRFEVTVARLLAFVEAYPDVKRAAGDGKSPHIAGDLGWQASYNEALPKTKEDLMAELHCADTTWVDSEDGALNEPANCVSFYLAYDFCIWDGGRLPTEAEWNYAAAGGSEQREYPWSTDVDDGLDLDHAYYGQTFGVPIDVGTKPKGNGRWGHSDLSGNVSEWALDYYSQVYPSTECHDCVNSSVQSTRVLRGGAFQFNASAQKVSFRGAGLPASASSYAGFRCVRDLPTTTRN